MDLSKIKKQGQKIKKDIFKKFIEIKEGHPGSILSIFDVVNCLYLGKFIKSKKKIKLNDYFIMSKGHAGSLQYPYLVLNGILNKNEWKNWGKTKVKSKKRSSLRIFPNNLIKGIDITSGSLGHGLGIAAGIAISDKQKKIKKNIWVIISEGELYEGSIWEALLFIKHHNLNQIKIILDRNNLIILGNTEDCLKLSPIKNKISGFGYNIKEINGHNYNQIFNGLNFLKKNDKKCKVLIANTIKGKSVSFMENKTNWHYWQKLTKMDEKKLINELKND